MKCSICYKEAEGLSSQNDNHVHKAKQNEIKHLHEQISLQRTKYNQTLERNFGRTQVTNSKHHEQSNPHRLSQNLVSKLTEKIAKKQNTIAEIKRLKQKIEEKKSLIQQCKKQRNQKLIPLEQAQNHLEKVRTQFLQHSQQKLHEIKTKINQKADRIKDLNKLVKRHFKQTFGKDLASILLIHRMFRLREAQKLFQIKKVDELDFFNYEKMLQSFYQIQNIEEITIKLKSSEKGIHTMFQNIIILQIVQQICKLWLPYQIQNKIDLKLSRIIGKYQNLRICGRKLIDYSKTDKISNIIVQFFDQSIQQANQSLRPVQTQQPTFQQIKPEFDESIEYNKRIYALSRDFINYQQVNVEFMSMKFGIQKRPMVFFESDLLQAIQKQFLWTLSCVDMDKVKPCPSQYFAKGYGSMLKELKVSKLIDSLQNMHSMKMTQEYAQSNKTIPEVVQSEGQWQQKGEQKQISKGETVLSSYLSSFSRYFYYEQSVYEPLVPESLQNVRSSSTENDQFQSLEPQANQ